MPRRMRGAECDAAGSSEALLLLLIIECSAECTLAAVWGRSRAAGVLDRTVRAFSNTSSHTPLDPLFRRADEGVVGRNSMDRAGEQGRCLGEDGREEERDEGAGVLAVMGLGGPTLGVWGRQSCCRGGVSAAGMGSQPDSSEGTASRTVPRGCSLPRTEWYRGGRRDALKIESRGGNVRPGIFPWTPC